MTSLSSRDRKRTTGNEFWTFEKNTSRCYHFSIITTISKLNISAIIITLQSLVIFTHICWSSLAFGTLAWTCDVTGSCKSSNQSSLWIWKGKTYIPFIRQYAQLIFLNILYTYSGIIWRSTCSYLFQVSLSYNLIFNSEFHSLYLYFVPYTHISTSERCRNGSRNISLWQDGGQGPDVPDKIKQTPDAHVQSTDRETSGQAMVGQFRCT